MLMVFMKIIVKCYRKKLAFGGSWGFWNFGWDPWVCKRKLVVYNSIQYNHRHKQTCRPIQIWSLWVRTQTESAISGILLIFSLINYLKYGNMALYELNVSLRVVIMNFVAGDVESIYKEQLFIHETTDHLLLWRPRKLVSVSWLVDGSSLLLLLLPCPLFSQAVMTHLIVALWRVPQKHWRRTIWWVTHFTLISWWNTGKRNEKNQSSWIISGN